MTNALSPLTVPDGTANGHAANLGQLKAARNFALRDQYLSPSAWIAETMSRAGGGITTGQTLTSGTLYLAAIALPKGAVISNINFTTGSTAPASLTNSWFALFDSNRVMLARTADQLTAGYATSAPKVLPIAADAAGAASSFTTTYEGLHYIGIMMKGTTPNNLTATATSVGAGALPPILFGTANTGQSTPPAFPFTASALTIVNNMPYAGVS